MRLRLTLRLSNGSVFPFSPNYAVSSWLYNAIRSNDGDYSAKLHSTLDPKLFVFSQVFVPKPFDRIGEIGLKPRKREVFFFLSSANSEFVHNSVEGLLSDQIPLRFASTGAELFLSSIEVMKDKSPEQFEIFKAIGPVATSVKKEGKVWYLRPHEPRFYENIKNNLLKKYKMVYGRRYTGSLEVEPIFERQKGKLSHLVELKGGHIIGFKLPFKIQASGKMKRVAYDCGLGEKNSQGFGMIEVM